MDKKKIVIIDDNKDYTFTMGVFLERNGFDVAIENDGNKGFEFIKKETPDVILLDVMMDTLFSGFEVCRKVKQDTTLKDIPVISVSGMSEEIKVKYDKLKDEEYFRPDAFYEKPVDKDVLLYKINQYLG